jgi:hypothetical protein
MEMKYLILPVFLFSFSSVSRASDIQTHQCEQSKIELMKTQQKNLDNLDIPISMELNKEDYAKLGQILTDMRADNGSLKMASDNFKKLKKYADALSKMSRRYDDSTHSQAIYSLRETVDGQLQCLEWAIGKIYVRSPEPICDCGGSPEAVSRKIQK